MISEAADPDSLKAARDQLLAAETVYWPHSKLEPLLAQFSGQDVFESLQGDPWLQNYYRSVWEKVHGKITLQTYPWHQAYAIADVCNASCAFCPSGYEKSGIFDSELIPQLATFISYARTLIFTGGEATVHPQFSRILKTVGSSIDPRCFFSLITNGARLDRFIPELMATPVSLAVSLNAATAATHEKIMGLGSDAWPKILESIRFFRSQGRYVALSMVVTRENLEEVPAFIELGGSLGVNTLYVRTLNPLGEIGEGPYTMPQLRVLEDYPALHPATHPDFEQLQGEAKAAIAASIIPVSSMPDQWSVPIPTLKPGQKLEALPYAARKESTGKGLPLVPAPGLAEESAHNPYDRQAPSVCDHVYYALQVLTQSHGYGACCFMGSVPGYDEVGLFASEDFFALRNSPAFVELRRRLLEGPLFPACRSCTYQLNY